MSSRKAIAGLGAMVGSILAKSQKKKSGKPAKSKQVVVFRPKKPARSSTFTLPHKQITQVAAPVTYGYRARPSGLSHKPVIVSGKGLCASISTSAGTQPILTGPSGAITGNAGAVSVDIDVAASSNAQTDFKLFPPQVYSIASCFLRWRLRKLVFTWVPSCPSSTTGSAAMCSSPEVVTSLAPSNLESSYVENAVSGTIWTSFSLNAMTNGLRKEWLFCETAVGNLQANIRQEAAGAFTFALFNQAASAQYGQIWADYEVEFEGLAVNGSYSAHRADASAPPLPQPLIEEEKQIEPEKYVQVPLTQPCTPLSVPPHQSVSGWFQPGATYAPPRL